MPDLSTLLNTIRDNASEAYQDRVPTATQTNLSEIGGVLLADVDLANEFTSALMNKIALTVVHSKIFKNPLAMLKKGTKPLGDSVEEIFVNYAKADAFDPAGSTLLNRKLPDVKSIYHTMNRQDKYKVTISYEMLSKAFRDYGTFNGFISSITNSLYNGANLDEFVLFKELIGKAFDDGTMVKVEIPDPNTSATNATSFIKAIKTVSGDMKFPKDTYNGYLTAQSTDTVPVVTFTPTEDQLIVIDNATNVSCDVDVLAKAFNLDRMQFLAQTIVIDAFPDPSIRAAIIDRDWSQIYDDLFTMRTFKNGEGLYDSYILHVWQTLSYSALCNAVAFYVPATTEETT